MKRWIKIGAGVFCTGLGGLWCLGLFIARVDPPEVSRVNMVIAIAAGILAFGINLLGQAVVSRSEHVQNRKNLVFGVSFAVWLIVSIGLLSWHQMVLHVRKTRAEEAIRRIKQEKLEPTVRGDSETRAADGAASGSTQP